MLLCSVSAACPRLHAADDRFSPDMAVTAIERFDRAAPRVRFPTFAEIRPIHFGSRFDAVLLLNQAHVTNVDARQTKQ
jgi:hypothetical protein